MSVVFMKACFYHGKNVKKNVTDFFLTIEQFIYAVMSFFPQVIFFLYSEKQQLRIKKKYSKKKNLKVTITFFLSCGRNRLPYIYFFSFKWQKHKNRLGKKNNILIQIFFPQQETKPNMWAKINHNFFFIH